MGRVRYAEQMQRMAHDSCALGCRPNQRVAARPLAALPVAAVALTVLLSSTAAAQEPAYVLPGGEPSPTETVEQAPQPGPEQTPTQEQAQEQDAQDDLGPTTLFQGGAKLLSMPATQLCPQENQCTPAETSIGFGVAALGRWRDFAFGGGFTWAFGFRPTTVAGSQDPELLRQHGRNYLVIEGLFRYYLPPLGSWEWWVGASAGALVVSDTFSTEADRNPYSDTSYVGPRALTLRSEGAAVSLGIGGHWRFTEMFIFGTHLRYANWLLPSERERTPLGDTASLAGRIDVIDAGVVLGALLPL